MTDGNELVVTTGAGALLPVMDITQAKHGYTAMVEFVKSILKDGTDFGTIPGTPKPTLYKPGAEKLNRFFGLGARFDLTKEVEEWHTEEPFFNYRYKCSLFRLSDGSLVAEGEGSCNSHEKKYRYRSGSHTCPDCGKEAIIKSKQKPGWYCFPKLGGCGSSFPVNQFTGEPERVANPDIADIVNTLQKMAQKRAFIAATLIAVNASEFFTQDVEDLNYGVVDGEVVGGNASEGPQDARSGAQSQPDAPAPAEWPARPWGLATVKAWLEMMYDDMSAASKTAQMTPDEHKKLGMAVSGLFPDRATRKVFQYLMFGSDNFSIEDMSVATGKTYRAWARDAKNAKAEVEQIIASQEFTLTSAAIANAQTEMG